jgi:hypothetical protein
VRQGPALGNPLLFAEGVPNAAAAHVSMALGFTGPCQTLLGTRTAGLDAVLLARLGILAGRWDQVIIGAAEECHPLVDKAYRHCRLCRENHTSANTSRPFADEAGFVTAAAGACVVVESLEHAQQRGATILAHLTDAGSISWPVDHLSIAADRVAKLLTALGCPAQIVTSANATWLGHLELMGLGRAMRRKAGDKVDDAVTLGAMYGHLGEAFSALPLCALAMTAVRGRLPALLAGSVQGSKTIHPASSDTLLKVAAVLASDYSGLTTAVRLEHP